MNTSVWNNLDLDFLEPGHQWHTDEGYFRYHRGRPLRETIDTAGNYCVTVNLTGGTRLRVAKALLIGMAALGAKTLPETDVDPELQPEAARKIERFQACGVPFSQCKNCGEPIPHRLESYWPAVSTPPYLKWVRHLEAEIKHEMKCWADMTGRPQKSETRVCKLVDPVWRILEGPPPNPGLRAHIYR